MLSNRNRIFAALALAPIVATLLFTALASASKPDNWPFGDSYKNRQDRGYVIPAAPQFPVVVPAPAAPVLTGAEVPVALTEEDPTIAYVVARVPAEAEVYIWDQKQNETGTIRTFGTPHLEKNKDYYYDVTIRWVEDGKWVSEKTRVELRAGGTYFVHVIDKTTPGETHHVHTEVLH